MCNSSPYDFPDLANFSLMCVYLCVRVFVHVPMHDSVYVCVCERERERVRACIRDYCFPTEDNTCLTGLSCMSYLLM
jgi:hypothetical protein